MWLVNCLVALSATRLVFGAKINWEQLRHQLDGPQRDSAAATLVGSWTERPRDFLAGIGLGAWKVIIPLLTVGDMAHIQETELENSPFACEAFAKHLPRILGREHLSKPLRFAIYKFLAGDKDANSIDGTGEGATKSWTAERGPQAIAALSLTESPATTGPVSARSSRPLKKQDSQILDIIKFIPVKWMEQDGKFIMNILVSSKPPQLHLLNFDSLAALLKNPRGACEPISVSALEKLDSMQLGLMTPFCMASIRGLASMNLASVVTKLPKKAFASYNGPLTKETLEMFSGEHIGGYASDFKGLPICTLLELHYLSQHSFWSVKSHCLHGYLSRKWEIGLRERWENVYLSTMNEFTREMRLIWTNIHPGDFIFMPKLIRQIVFMEPLVCAGLEPSYLSPEVLADVSSPCLYAILSRPGPQIRFGERWAALEPKVIGSFTNVMLKAVEKIDPSDFWHMRLPTLDRILKSPAALDSLPQPVDQIMLSSTASSLELDQQQFAAIARVAPNVAGQLLLLIDALPVNILADCDGPTLRTLTCNNRSGKNFDWVLLFAELEKEDSFDEIAEFMSVNGKIHLCATITTLEEYLTLSWLRRHMSSACRAAIGLDLSDVFIFLRAPELALGAVPWRTMLKAYSVENWREIFSDKDLATELGHICDFWKMVVVDGHQAIMAAAYPGGLKLIQPDCVHELGSFLRDNPRVAPFLADDAFSTHQAGQLPCSLRELSTKQIASLSNGLVSRVRYPTAEHKARHALSNITLDEVGSLRFAQFTSLFVKHWTFIPDGIKFKAATLHLEAAIKLLSNFIAKEKSKAGKSYSSVSAPNKEEDDLEVILDALEVYGTLAQVGYAAVNGLDFAPLVSVMGGSHLRDRFTDILLGCDSFRVLLIGLVQSADELYNTLRNEAIGEFEEKRQVKLPFSRKTGFDRAAIASLLSSCPESFGSVTARITSGSINDAGGLGRMLTLQVLSDIGRDLIVNGEKFVWGVSGEAGFMVGFFLGKTFQLNMRLPFGLDRGIFVLFTDTSDKAIEKYYKATYKGEASRFMQMVNSLYGPGQIPNPELLDVLTRPECIRFTRPSLAADPEEAKNDFGAKTNIWACGKDECYDSIERLKRPGFLRGYFRAINSIVLAEFKRFVREMVRGMGHTLSLARDFPTTSPQVLRPFAEFFPVLINAEPIDGKSILNAVEFVGDIQVQSFGWVERIRASEVFTAFILSLDNAQLRHLLTIWTGTPTISLNDTKLVVKFGFPKDRPVQLDFCTPSPSGRGTFVIAPGSEYLQIFNRIARRLFGPGLDLEPDCTPGGVKIKLVSTLVCLTTIFVPIQSAQKLINSLIDLINTPATCIF